MVRNLHQLVHQNKWAVEFSVYLEIGHFDDSTLPRTLLQTMFALVTTPAALEGETTLLSHQKLKVVWKPIRADQQFAVKFGVKFNHVGCPISTACPG
jgi:hypothetical protein